MQVIEALRPRAEAGDMDAAFNVFLKANECRISIAAAQRAAPKADPTSVIPSDCRGPDEASYREAAKWLELVADSGNQYAQLLYANSTAAILGPPSELLRDPGRVQAYKKKAMGYLHANAAKGSVDAWEMLSSAYASCVAAPRDNLKAYAYYRAVQLADPRFAAPTRLDQLRDRLSAQELSVAEANARSVYEGKN